MSKFFNRIVPAEDRKTFVLALVIGVLSLILDQLTKYWVVKEIPFASRQVVIPHFFNLTYVTNTGAAWGILSGRYWLLLTISAAVFFAALWFMQYLTEGWKERYFAVLLILSGILGNCIDRLFRGAVVDFLQFYIGKFVWPSFNVADSCICIGVFIYILSTLFRPNRKKSDPDSLNYVHYKQ